MSPTSPSCALPTGGRHSSQVEFTRPLRQFREALTAAREDEFAGYGPAKQNVGRGERLVSAAAGSILAMLGLGRRDLTGALIAGVGGALVYRGATGHCSMYQALGVSTAQDDAATRSAPQTAKRARREGVHITESFLINKSPEELYAYWRNFENFPNFMTHLKSVQRLDDRRSHWVAKAPAIVGGQVEWDAEIVADEPNERIAWRTVEGADVAHAGSVRFVRALGDRGAAVRVDLEYHPPAGGLGQWFAKLFGEEPEQQIREDLRKFKRIMEIGEVISTEGQPRGTCLGRGRRE